MYQNSKFPNQITNFQSFEHSEFLSHLILSFDIWNLGFERNYSVMLPKELLETLQSQIARVDHPRELAVDVMFALQNHYGYLSDEALEEGARLLGMTPLELEELATFYDFIYREPVGRYRHPRLRRRRLLDEWI